MTDLIKRYDCDEWREAVTQHQAYLAKAQAALKAWEHQHRLMVSFMPYDNNVATKYRGMREQMRGYLRMSANESRHVLKELAKRIEEEDGIL